jgi:DNA-binding response OmpR family regulator
MKSPQSRHGIVLIVEDDEETAESLKEALEVMGYESDVASNGQVALDYLRRTPIKYCLVLLDIIMPVMNGWDFLREQHADNSVSGIPSKFEWVSDAVKDVSRSVCGLTLCEP